MLQAYNYNTGAPISATFGTFDGYTSGTDFTCTSSYCKGVTSAVAATFESLQNELNKYAAFAGFALLRVDGWIGSKTVAATNKAAAWARSSSGILGPFQYLSISDTYKGIAEVAANAAGIRDDLQTLAIDLNLTAVKPPTRTVKKPGTTRLPSGTGVISPLGKKKSKTVWWIVGAAALVGIGTIGYMTFTRKPGTGKSR